MIIKLNIDNIKWKINKIKKKNIIMFKINKINYNNNNKSIYAKSANVFILTNNSLII
jgi:hypothetical protein